MNGKDQPPDKGRLQFESAQATPRKRLGRGQKALLIASIAIAIIGLGLQAAAWITSGDEPPPPAAGTSSGTDSGIVSGFAPGNDQSASETAADGPEPSALETWSPALFRLGFSFFVGFCIAYALRAFIKTALITIGLLLIALFALQSAGIVDVDWSGMGDRFDSAMQWVRAQATSFQNLVTGYLPSAASAGAGLFMGFRRS